MSISQDYADLLAAQDAQLNTLNRDYYVARENIKQMQDSHFDKTKYAADLQRLEAAHEQEVKTYEVRFEQEKQAVLKEKPAPERDLQPQKSPAPDISDSQDIAAQKLAEYRLRQEELQRQHSHELDRS